MRSLADTHAHQAMVREAHTLAEFLKAERPAHRLEVEELQRIVTRAHFELDALRAQSSDAAIQAKEKGDAFDPNSVQSGREASCLNNLWAAHQSLRDLRYLPHDAGRE